jgi:hypothetical protein
MLNSGRLSINDNWVDAAQARFDDLNAALVLRTGTLLNRLVADAALHPRFINTLALLEHTGSRRIMATQQGEGIDQPTLKHLAEECHHAFFMKRQAEKAASRSLAFVDADLLAPRAARHYFRRLETALLRQLRTEGSPRATYLYMSMLVEFRAVWFYRLYQQTLTRHDHRLSLKRLLGEEQSHLTDMAARLEHAGELSNLRVDAFVNLEHALYERLLESLQRSIS